MDPATLDSILLDLVVVQSLSRRKGHPASPVEGIERTRT